MNRSVRRTVWLAAMASVFAIGACRAATIAPGPAATSVVSDRLYFGRNMPGGGTVSDAEWTAFVDSVVTPRFPNGLTIWQGQGQWRDPAGALVREAVMVLEVLHPDGAGAERAVREIADEYKRRFRQDAVLRATERTTMRLHD